MSQVERRPQPKSNNLIFPAMNVLRAIELGLPVETYQVTIAINNLCKLMELGNENKMGSGC